MTLLTKKSIQKAENVDIVDFCEKNGIDLTNEGNKYFRLVEHDSLLIDRQKNKYYWNSKQTSGNSIDFVQDVVLNKKDFRTAVGLLLNNDKDLMNHDDIHISKENFVYQDDEIPDFNRAKNYLHEERHISERTINEFRDANILAEDKYHNTVFKWASDDRKSVIGASKQGTIVDFERFGKRGTSKFIQKNSTTNYGFNFTVGEPKNLKFFESSIDLMSYRDLNPNLKDTQLVSMEGLKHKVVDHYFMNSLRKTTPESIGICVDKDEAGDNFYSRFGDRENEELVISGTNSVVSIKRELPPYGKDWNDSLKQINSNKSLEHSSDRKNAIFLAQQRFQSLER